MRVGILDILALPARHPADISYHLLITKQFASITPQAVAVWCRRLGHETFYAVYYGVGDARRLLPTDLDIVFIACYTQASAIAYALSLLYRKAGVRTVIGGPHAKAFPLDCLRFFDLVVKECDQSLIADILAGHFAPGSLISSDQPFDDVPTVEERMLEIRASAFYWRKRPLVLSTIPMLASVGCPYQCNFCIDWKTPYRALASERLVADLRYLAKHYPGVFVVFHDPNFAVKFEQMFEALETLPPGERPPYMMECSLTVLRGERMKRLQETNCVLIAPGVESWADYSNKAGVGKQSGMEKAERVVAHFRLLADYVPYLQANFIFGLDSDMGDEPVELTKYFMEQTPFVWPALNIPVPFGGTPLYDELLSSGRILKPMPFSFYYTPYLTMALKHYDPVNYYEKLIELFSFASSPGLLKRRMKSTNNWRVKLVHWARTASTRASLRNYRQILQQLQTNAHFRAFHEGRSERLPEFYHRHYEQMLGQYGGLLSRADRMPILVQTVEQNVLV